MKLEAILRQLSESELSNTSIGSSGIGVISEGKVSKVLTHINEGILKLYTLFVLDEKDVLVEMRERTIYYHLHPDYSESNWNRAKVDYPYIKDMPEEPFLGDVIKVLSVHRADGYTYPLNDPEQVTSVFTPRANTLQIPHPEHGRLIGIHYQAKHPVLTGDDLESEILLPDVLIEPLRAYVASNVYSHINTQDATYKSREFDAKFRTICEDVINRDLVNSSYSVTNSKFNRRGYI